MTRVCELRDTTVIHTSSAMLVHHLRLLKRYKEDVQNITFGIG